MRLRPSDLWKWDGTIDRGSYAIAGVVLFALKHNIDRFVASFVFDRPWSIFNYYFSPSEVAAITSLPPEDRVFYRAILAIALPFICVGVLLTLRRLRSAGLPLWLVVFFFFPFVNLLFFVILAILPEKEILPHGRKKHSRILDRLIPNHPIGSAAFGMLVPLVPTAVLALLSTNFLESYGWGLFVGLPFCMGLFSVLIYGYHERRPFGWCLLVATVAANLLGAALVALMVEGVICIAMAAPIMLFLTLLGGLLGYLIQLRPGSGRSGVPAGFVALVIALPLLMGAEARSPGETGVIAVRTSVEIDAPPQTVWKHVVSFTELPAPENLLFKTGVAYPLRAEIEGRGVGAVRHCVFSTGAFVEPITVWDEPRLLKFDVVGQPPCLEEWSPFGKISPAHIDDYLVSEGGQFLLTELPNGRTRLEGTTWYRHQISPARYWQVWSDAIIHRIHVRVLTHVKHLAESSS